MRDQPKVDWDAARSLSLRPGGFGERRAELWPRLLNAGPLLAPADADDTLVDEPPETHSAKGDVVEPHPDERQIRLDTDRSFVLYPVGETLDRAEQQNELHDLIVGIFRKRRRLSYFQGYHDIISVLFLTMPHELQLPVAEKFSLHRVRDSMGASLEPVVGLLRILKRVLALADPSYAALLEHHSPLPYYALSNLLTLFSHDMPTLPLIQHVFDYLLCRPPIAVVYLAAAVVLSRKQEALRMAEEGEDGMIHSLLSGLPDLYDGDEPAREESGSVETSAGEAPDIETPSSRSLDDEDHGAEDTSETEVSRDTPADYSEAEDTAVSDEETLPPPEEDATLLEEALYKEKISSAAVARKTRVVRSLDASRAAVDERDSTAGSQSEHDSEPIDEAAAMPKAHSASTRSSVDSTRSRSPDDQQQHPTRARVSLCSLLEQADALCSLYPPTHASVDVHAIMGPQSVVFTWTEDPAGLPSDDGAELMVTQPHLVVLPAPEEHAREGKEEKDGQVARRRGRHLRRPVRLGPVVLERRAMVASAVVVLGVAMAVYGLQAGGMGERQHGAVRELRRLTRYVGGIVLGMSGKFLDGMAAGRSKG